MIVIYWEASNGKVAEGSQTKLPVIHESNKA